MNPRQAHLSGVRSLVVKLGSQLLTGPGGALDQPFLERLASQVAAIRAAGRQVTLVSSGAVAAGLVELGLKSRPTDLAQLQAVAAVGQRRLMDAWAEAFAPLRLKVAQILLTREDIDHRARYLNLRNTIGAIHRLGGVPIINENDTVSTDEIVRISFGDNDILAANVAQALGAGLLVLLSVVDGVLDEAGRPVRLVERIAQAAALVRPERSALGRGGMDSKLQAARQVTGAGDLLAVANGRQERVLERLLAGEEVGTLFVPSARRRSSRSRWLGSARPRGTILVDAGAARALTQRQRSLLPAGVVGVEGQFQRGDVVAIRDPDGTVIAQGLANYAADDLAQIRGLKTTEVRRLLGDAAYDEVVHRDNLVLHETAG
jgi:glutamate 5-kinase